VYHCKSLFLALLSNIETELKNVFLGKNCSQFSCNRVTKNVLVKLTTGEPNGGTSENCVNLWSGPEYEPHGFWNDLVSML
jgi:hypothetical protein